MASTSRGNLPVGTIKVQVKNFYGLAPQNQAVELKQLKGASLSLAASQAAQTIVVKPKRAKRAFDFFLDDYMRLHAETLDELSSLRWAMRTSKDSQDLFKALDEAKRQKYESLATASKSRYDAELIKYQASLPPASKEEATKTPQGMTTSKRPSSTRDHTGDGPLKEKKRSRGGTKERLLSEDEDDSDDEEEAGFKSEESSDDDSEGAPRSTPGALVPAPTAYAAARPRREFKAPAPAPAPAPALAARPPASSIKGKPPAGAPRLVVPKAPQPAPMNPPSSRGKAQGLTGVSNGGPKGKGKASSSSSPFTPLPQIVTKSAVKKNADKQRQAEKMVKEGKAAAAGKHKGAAAEENEEEQEEEEEEGAAPPLAIGSKLKSSRRGKREMSKLKVSPGHGHKGESSEDLPEWILKRSSIARVTRSAANKQN